MIITPNKIELEGEEITDEDISLDLKETELLLKKARLNVGLPTEEPIQEEKQVDKPEPEPKSIQKAPKSIQNKQTTHDLGCEIQHTGKCNCGFKEPELSQEDRERIEKLKEINF